MDRCSNKCGKSKEEDSNKETDYSTRKCRKKLKYRVFPMFWGSGGSISWLGKAAGAEPCGRMSDSKLHASVARSKFEIKISKADQVQTLFEIELIKKPTQP